MNNVVSQMTKRLLRCAQGVAAIEFALVLPLLLILSLPLYNYIQYIMVFQKVNKTSATIADMIVMSTPSDATTTAEDADNDKLILSTHSLQMILESSTALMQPFSFPNANGSSCATASIRVDSVYKPTGGSAGTVWQATYSGTAGTVNVTNHATPQAIPATMSAAFASAMVDEENTIIVDVTCTFTPPISMPLSMGLPMLSTTPVRAVYRFPARNEALKTVFLN